MSNAKSFEDLEFWLNQGREFIFTPCIAFLIGLKCDLPKVIEEDLVKDFWISEKLEYYECSSVTGEGCEDLLGFLISSLFFIILVTLEQHPNLFLFQRN